MKIPRIFHAIWVGSELPDQHRCFLTTWQEHHPGWELKLWTDAELAEFPLQNGTVYEEAELIAPGSVGQLRADVARYEILLKHGGVYIDTDMECLHSIDDLCRTAEPKAFAAWEAEGRWVNNAVLGASPGHPFIRALVEGLQANVLREINPGIVRPNVLTGPQYLTAIFKRMPSALHVFPKVTFYPYLWNELHRGGEPFPNSYAVHHWANMRKRKGVPL